MARLAALPVIGRPQDTGTAEFANNRLEWRRLVAEPGGTFLLVLVAAGADVVNAVSHGQVGRTVAVTAPGLMVLALIYTIGATSGAHLNPAVTVGFAARGHFPWGRVPGYVLAQVCGARQRPRCCGSCSAPRDGWAGPSRARHSGRDRPGHGNRAELRADDRDPRDILRPAQRGPQRRDRDRPLRRAGRALGEPGQRRVDEPRREAWARHS